MRTIKPSNNNGSIRIRFNHQKQKFDLCLKGLHWDRAADRATATAIAANITADIEANELDGTLNRYRPKKAAISRKRYQSTLEIWDGWVESLELGEVTQANHYAVTRRAIERGDLFRPGLSAFTHNLRLRLIRQAYAWARSHNIDVNNPYAHIHPKRSDKPPIRVFQLKELQAIAAAIDSLFPHYGKFIRALTISGCRFGEIAGLTHRYVDPEKGTVQIVKAVRYNRATDTLELIDRTKTGSVRTLRSRQLVALCGPPGAPDDLVFKSVTGRMIRLSYFRLNVWKPALKEAGVPYRKIHTLRHTALSRALEAGLSVPQVADMAGHANNTMVLQTYGHIITRPDVPEVDL